MYICGINIKILTLKIYIMSDSNNVGKGLFLFLCGAAIGAAAGILLAPDKGKNTREKLAKTAKDLSNTAREKIENIANSAESLLEDLKKTKSKQKKEVKAEEVE